jgi:deazaflavin-dependent oxidoreductase (nitroreductase family)
VPIPKSVASFNKQVTNRVTGPFAGHLPGFAIVHHVGRVSGRAYRNPVNVFRHDDGYVFVLTYGADVDWVKNVEAAQGCEIETRGRTVRLVEPHRFTDPARQAVPRVVRAILSVIDVDEFMSMRVALTTAG